MSLTKILVVEDEVITAEAIAEQLEQLGYTVTDTVTCGEKALESVTQTQPDLILMDISLTEGGTDGITAAARIRDRFKVPVVFLTAYSDETTLEKALETEPFGYLLKPFNERSLRVTIETALYKHRMERELVAQKELLSTILNSTSDAVVATDENGAIAYMNPAAETFTGWTLPEALGQGITEVVRFVDEITETPVENPVMQVLQEGRVVHFDEHIALVAKDGTNIPVGNSTSPMTQDTGNVTGAVLILWDVSDRQRTQALKTEITEIQQSNAEVRKILEAERELNQLKSRLITTISHEYRTPLTIVVHSSELLRYYSHKLSEEKKQTHFDRIQAAVVRMTRLIENVLTFGKVEAGQLPFHPALVDVKAFCHDLIEEQQLLLGSKHTLNLIYQGNCTGANLDSQLLRHVLTNLLANAVKFSPSGGTVSVIAGCENDRIIFSVQDNGIGIPAAEQSRLFETFFRASNVGNISGTGMGLAIVKKCVELHNGQITVISEVNVGTTFTVNLPLI